MGGNGMPVHVVRWCAEECERQRSGERSVYWMVQTYAHLWRERVCRECGGGGTLYEPVDVVLDGNGRLGSLVLSMMLGMLKDPIFPPDVYDAAFFKRI